MDTNSHQSKKVSEPSEKDSEQTKKIAEQTGKDSEQLKKKVKGSEELENVKEYLHQLFNDPESLNIINADLQEMQRNEERYARAYCIDPESLRKPFV